MESDESLREDDFRLEYLWSGIFIFGVRDSG